MNHADDPSLVETEFQYWRRIAGEKPPGVERKLANMKAIDAMVREITKILEDKGEWPR